MSNSKQHPHLYFTKTDLPKLKSKAKHSTFEKDYDAIIARANDNLIPTLDIKVDEHAILNQPLCRAETCAFAWQLTKDKRYLNKAKDTLLQVLKLPEYKNNKNDNTFSLGISAFASHCARTFDWIAEELSDEEISLFITKLKDEIVDLFMDECQAKNKYLYGNRTMNHLSVYCGPMAELLVVMDKHDIDLSNEIEIVRAHLLRYIEWYDDAGVCLETNGYWAYGMGNAIKGLLAFKMNGWPNIFHQKAKKLDRMCYPHFYFHIEDKTVANFNDCPYGVSGQILTRHFSRTHKDEREYSIPEGCDARFVHSNIKTLALIFAAEFQDKKIQWWASQFKYSDSAGFIFGDPNLESEPPVDLPTSAVFHSAGIMTLRDSLIDPNAKLLGMKAGRARGKVFDDPHCQFDLNSVVLDAFGTTLLADPGYLHDWSTGLRLDDPDHISYSTKAHNTILIDGQGQLTADSPIAHFQQLSPSEDIDYVVSRLERGYGNQLIKFDRHAYMVDKDFYVIIDEIELQSQNRITWNFHGLKDAIYKHEGQFSISHNGTRLVLLPFGECSLSCQYLTDHFLPRLQFDTTENKKTVTVGWLLLIEKDGNDISSFKANLNSSKATIEDIKTNKKWDLPIVSRKASIESDIMIPFPDRASI
ncbi:MAG: hypothetical protein COA79_05760 [Planctomycetota bacterium]|nr:MAG: hypothetical protein COA79_05760 [Planctomycetota bacterium]